jgi:hypothetical protein
VTVDSAVGSRSIYKAWCREMKWSLKRRTAPYRFRHALPFAGIHQDEH